jgi:hypothetical protein
MRFLGCFPPVQFKVDRCPTHTDHAVHAVFSISFLLISAPIKTIRKNPVNRVNSPESS